MDQSIKEYKKKIFLLDDDKIFCEQIENILKTLGEVHSFTNAKDFFNALDQNTPELVLIDLNLNDPNINGFDVIIKLKKRKDAHLLPIVMISGADSSEILQRAFHSGIEDYVQKPIIPSVFTQKIEHVIFTHYQKVHMNPLTGLPGNRIIEEEFYKRISDLKIFSIAYLDMDNFKPFNDTKGVKKGDKAIQFLAFELINARNAYTKEQFFTGHLGGDDFFIIGNKTKIRESIKLIYEKFSKKMKVLFTEREIKQNYYLGFSRIGEEKKFPLLTLSTSLINIPSGLHIDFETITELAAAIKKKAKNLEGFSIYEHTLQYTPSVKKENLFDIKEELDKNNKSIVDKSADSG